MVSFIIEFLYSFIKFISLSILKIALLIDVVLSFKYFRSAICSETGGIGTVASLTLFLFNLGCAVDVAINRIEFRIESLFSKKFAKSLFINLLKNITYIFGPKDALKLRFFGTTNE